MAEVSDPYASLDQAIDDLVYRHEDPWERVRQSNAIRSFLVRIVRERLRQEQIGERKRAEGIDWRSCADPAMDGGDMTRSAVLGEEYGEVCRAALEATYAGGDVGRAAEEEEHLDEELVQTAAVSLAWHEAIAARREP